MIGMSSYIEAQPSDEMTAMFFRAGMTSPLGIGTGFGIRFRDHPIAHFVFLFIPSESSPVILNVLLVLLVDTLRGFSPPPILYNLVIAHS